MASRRITDRGRPLTVGDGFRVGFGIGFWMIAWTMVVWVVCFLGFGLLSLMRAS